MTKPTKSTTATTPRAEPDEVATPPKRRRRAGAKKDGADAGAARGDSSSPLELAAALNAPPVEPAPPAPDTASSSASVSAAAGSSAGDAAPAAADTADDTADVPFAERVRLRGGVVELLVFRVGTELFATALPAIEEALELPSLSHLPEMPPSMLGVISLRGRMLPAYSPARPLGVALARADAAALVVRAGDRRVALAVDDVDDVMTVDLAELRPAPILAGEERDAVLLGVAARGAELVAVLDADALVTACLSDQALEIA